MKDDTDMRALLCIEVDDKGEAKLKMKGRHYALMAMLVAMMFKDQDLRSVIETAVSQLEKEQGNLELLEQEEDGGKNTVEEFAVFWAKVEDAARSVKHIFKSDYYKYKDAINEVAKKSNANNWLIKQALKKIASYSNYSGD